jgi:hypothetical protein
MARNIHAIAWETEVWVAESPSHLIHFNGARFLGPYPRPEEPGTGTKRTEAGR